eukprot:TRINITY_DN9783_c0_g2_i1.p1 TRINITY_DN9783_c0_g2~~TRINITY_DN9783_c0_g2_i1.p1  ORF type:complete len:350 (-),score=69.90 TRINITY_DN9783_c0_g2_i1:45-1094(-)
MMLDEDFPHLLPSVTSTQKTWISIGGGREVLVQQSTAKDKDVTDEIVVNKAVQSALKPGDLVWHADQWTPIAAVTNNVVNIKMGEKSVEVALEECRTRIRLQVLVCTPALLYLHIVSVGAEELLSKLGKRLSKKFSVKTIKPDWYYNGKLCAITDTVESIGIKNNDKIVCTLLGYDIKTFKRFKEIEAGRGWYMSHSSPDAIAFIPSKGIVLFGFGMYYTLSGPETYTIKYELILNEEVKLENTATISKGDNPEQIWQVFFNEHREPVFIPGGMKVVVSVLYTEFNNDSRLQVGHQGNEYDSVQGNEPGLFTVEDTGRSHNGTGLSSGQIPELYYSVDKCILNCYCTCF